MERGLTNRSSFALEMARRADKQKMQQSVANFGMPGGGDAIRQEPGMISRGLSGARRLFFGEQDPRNKSVLDPKFIPMQGAPAKYEGAGMDLAMPLMTLYHGSPHMFNKFDMSKIGTGEGNQAYGYGLYMAENPGVAGSYASMSHKQIVESAADVLKRQAADEELSVLKRKSDAMTLSDLYEDMPLPKKEYEELQVKISNLESKRAAKILEEEKKRAGNLYQVDLPDEHIEKMLDWDKKFEQQPKSVQKTLRKLFPQSYLDDLSDSWNQTIELEGMTGSELHQMVKRSGVDDRMPRLDEEYLRPLEDDERAALFLKREGVPGVKYRDGNSRNINPGFSYGERFGEKSASYTIGGEFVSSPPLKSKADAKIWYDNEMDKRAKKNFVVFDDTLPQITHRNNQSLGFPQATKK